MVKFVNSRFNTFLVVSLVFLPPILLRAENCNDQHKHYASKAACNGNHQTSYEQQHESKCMNSKSTNYIVASTILQNKGMKITLVFCIGHIIPDKIIGGPTVH
jgi:hypothetical protein